MSWLPEDFVHPERVELPTGHHLRPIRASDVDMDYPAVMGSRESLWARFGEMWGWPPEDMSHEADRQDLARHEAEISAQVTFNYAVPITMRPTCSDASTSTRRASAPRRVPTRWSHGGWSTASLAAISNGR
jgi:hypothetical protein